MSSRPLGDKKISLKIKNCYAQDFLKTSKCLVGSGANHNNKDSDIGGSDSEDENEALYNAPNTVSKKNDKEDIASFHVNDAPKK